MSLHEMSSLEVLKKKETKCIICGDTAILLQGCGGTQPLCLNCGIDVICWGLSADKFPEEAAESIAALSVRSDKDITEIERILAIWNIYE